MTPTLRERARARKCARQCRRWTGNIQWWQVYISRQAAQYGQKGRQ